MGILAERPGRCVPMMDEPQQEGALFSLIAVLFIIVPSAALILIPFTLKNMAASSVRAQRQLPPAVGKGIDANRWLKSAQEHLRDMADAA